MTRTITPADRRARVTAWTGDVWAAHLPRETDAAWISFWLSREKRKRVRRWMKARLQELTP